MRSLLVLLVLGAPAVAFAQGADPAPPPPAGGTYSPATGNPPYSAPPPASPPPGPYGSGTGPYAPPPPTGAPPPQPYGQPYPQPYAQPYGQPYQAPPPPPLRSGMTFEANLGIGWLRISDSGESITSDLGAGIGIGVGGWISEKTAVTGRLSGTSVTFGDFGSDIRFNQYFLGAAIQYWVDDHLWVGGGAGLAMLAASADGSSNSDSTSGVGLQGRIGYSFTTGSENTFNISAELTPGFYSENGDSGSATGMALLLGYQHL